MNSNKPKVSVIMSVYNDQKYLYEAIESILEQSYKDFEFIICNDGSTDDSAEIIDKFKNKDHRIILIEHKNLGLTKSLNKAIKLSKGDYIARMDSDDISDSERFLKQVNFLEANLEYALIGTNVVKIDEHGNDLGVNKTKYTHQEICATFKKRNCIAHGSVMINKLLVGKMLFYDEDYQYAQDYRLWVSLAKHFKVSNLKEPLYKLRLHSSSISKEKIESQSIYAGLVAYEFSTGKVVKDADNKILENEKLRLKIGKILLMNFEFELSKKYFKKYNKFYFFSIILNLLKKKHIKSLAKLFK